MWEKIVSFFMAIFAFLSSLFGIGGGIGDIFTKSKEFTNLSYGTSEQQVMDLYLPKEDKSGAGLFVFIHGGAWMSGSKDSEVSACKEIARNYGYAAMTMSYRLFDYPTNTADLEAKIADPNSLDALDMMNDITEALKVAVNKASANGCKISKIALVGYSAGAHLAMLYSYAYKSNAPKDIAFCVSYVGPADLTDPAFCINTPVEGLGDFTAQYLASRLSHKLVTAANFNDTSTQTALKAVSPLYQVKAGSVPTILVYGAQDILVPIAGSRALDAKLTQLGIKHEYIVYQNSGHDLENAADKAANDNNVYTSLLNYAKEYFGY